MRPDEVGGGLLSGHQSFLIEFEVTSSALPTLAPSSAVIDVASVAQ